MVPRRFWPSRDQLLLLQFCLLPHPDAARAAWRSWSKQVDLDDLDGSSFRIMSLVYRRLVELQVDSPDLARIKGIYRYHWTRNQIAWRGKADLLRAIQAQGIDVLLLKGAALGPTVYPEPHARAMHDLDFLVPTADAERSILLLRERGWIEQHFDVMNTIAYFHGCSFLHPDFGEADLHWHVMRSHCRTDRDEELWAAARPFSYAGLNVKMLCPEDQFLHACEHGQHHSAASALQWLADATLVLRRHAEHFDWTRLADQARKFRLTLCVRETLRYLECHFGVGVPAETNHALAQTKVRWVERVELALAHRPNALEHHPLRRVALAACHHVKARPNLGWGEACKSFELYYRLLTHERRAWPVIFREETVNTLLRLWDEMNVLRFRSARRLQSGKWPRGGFIGDLPPGATEGFYKIETVLGSPFRWSADVASLRLPLQPSTTLLCLYLQTHRPRGRLLEDGLEFAIDGQTVAPSQITRKGGHVFIRLDQSLAITEGLHTLSWKVRPWPALGDPRLLGLPISRVWVV